MTYWLMLSTLYYAHVFGVYPTKDECEAAGESAVWYQAARCVPQPTPQPKPDIHPHPPAAP